MSWKLFKKQLSSKELDDETRFILGIDIGTRATKIAIWNVNRKQAELIDMSGGYGNPSIPTVMQYIPENKEWVFGEYALLNKGDFDDITINNIISKLGTKELIEISGKAMNIPSILARYIREIIDMCKNLNPNGEVVGLVATVPDYFSEEAKEEFKRAFAMAGLEKVLITFMSFRECVLRYLYFGQSIEKKENVLFIDYGGEQIRGGLVQVNPEDEKHVKAESLSFLFDSSLGGKKLDKLLKELFIDFYCEETGLLRTQLDEDNIHQIEVFAYQSKGFLFQNYYRRKPTKLYFNFAYPAFQKTLEVEQMDKLIEPLAISIKEFISNLLKKTINGEIKKEEIDKIIAVGGGFEMNWVKRLMKNEFPEIDIEYPKDSEGTLALGACLGAASYLGVIPEFMIDIKDCHKLTFDIGVKGLFEKKTRFIPLMERNTFWWQESKAKIFILDLGRDNFLEIPLYAKNDQGETKTLDVIKLDNLPRNPSRTLRLKFDLKFNQYDSIELSVKDCGFGEIIPPSDYFETFNIKL